MSRSAWFATAMFAVLSLGTTRQSPEQVRLRSHFDSVLVELRARNVTMLSPAQRSSREQLIAWLVDYRDAGRFPTNDRYSNEQTPIFRDARGATCAMAYLIERSGRRDIVDRVAATQNLAYIRELSSDTSLVAWLHSAGLSVAEAARIQPAYPGGDTPVSNQTARTVTVVFSGTSLVMSVANVLAPMQIRGYLGMGLGALTLAVGKAIEHKDGPYPTINYTSGGLAIVTGLYAAYWPHAPKAARTAPMENRSVQWSPIIDINSRSGQSRVGIAARF